MRASEHASSTPRQPSSVRISPSSHLAPTHLYTAPRVLAQTSSAELQELVSCRCTTSSRSSSSARSTPAARAKQLSTFSTLLYYPPLSHFSALLRLSFLWPVLCSKSGSCVARGAFLFFAPRSCSVGLFRAVATHDPVPLLQIYSMPWLWTKGC